MSTPRHSVPIAGHRIGAREIGLLLLAAGFAALMIDVDKLAIVAGWSVVGVWSFTMIRGPRPSTALTFVYGAGLFVTTFWWPQQGWWPGAIALMWIGAGLMAIALLGAIWSRFRSTPGDRAYNP